MNSTNHALGMSLLLGAMMTLNTHVGGIEDPLLLSAVHVVTTLTGSAVLALAVYNNCCGM